MSREQIHEYREYREIGSCGGCRWMCTAGTKRGACMLDKGNERCRFYGTEADWQSKTGYRTGRAVDEMGEAVELHVMRLGVARFHLAKAAAILDQPSTSIRLREGAPEFLAEVDAMVVRLLHAENWLYERQTDAATTVRKALPGKRSVAA